MHGGTLEGSRPDALGFAIRPRSLGGAPSIAHRRAWVPMGAFSWAGRARLTSAQFSIAVSGEPVSPAGQWGFRQTDLELILPTGLHREPAVCGVTTDVCVKQAPCSKAPRSAISASFSRGVVIFLLLHLPPFS